MLVRFVERMSGVINHAATKHKMNGKIVNANFATKFFVQNATIVKTKGALNRIIVVVMKKKNMIHTKEKNHAHAFN